MISFDDAILRLSAGVKAGKIETLPLAQASGHYTAKTIVAKSDFPAFPASAMDGYAVRDADIAAFPVKLPMVGKAFAGAGFTGEFPPGTCVRVFTGAPVPEGTERVVIQEDVLLEGNLASFIRPAGERRHIRPRASDFATGEILVPAGTLLGPRQLVAIAAADIAEVDVVVSPTLSIICCGDELRAPGQTENYDCAVPESISFGVTAMATHWGAHVNGYAREPDDLARLHRAAESALTQSDIIVVIGGASVGEKDFAKAMFEPQDLTYIFNKVAIRPGKPIWLAGKDGKVVIGLPGNPTSALVTARLFLAPLIVAMAGGRVGDALDWQDIALRGDVAACDDRETFLKAKSSRDGAVPLSNQDSAAQKTLAATDLILRRPPGSSALQAGSIVAALVF